MMDILGYCSLGWCDCIRAILAAYIWGTLFLLLLEKYTSHDSQLKPCYMTQHFIHLPNLRCYDQWLSFFSYVWLFIQIILYIVINIVVCDLLHCICILYKCLPCLCFIKRIYSEKITVTNILNTEKLTIHSNEQLRY